jgi:hypothetical protein
VGDRVYLKLQPYVQSSLAPRSSQKLSFKYFGPYTVEERIGSLAYRLALPPSAHIHPVFQVSLLKQSMGNQVVSSSLPSVLASMVVPEHILQRRVSAGERPVLQGLIKWPGLPSTLATWENLEALRQRFPMALTWGQVASQGEEGVSNSGSATPVPDTAGPRPKRQAKPNPRVTSPEWEM